MSFAKLNQFVFFRLDPSPFHDNYSIFLCFSFEMPDIPLSKLLANPQAVTEDARLHQLSLGSVPLTIPSSSSSSSASEPCPKEILLLCRQGNDSQIAAAALRKALASPTPADHEDDEKLPDIDGKDRLPLIIQDVRGGLAGWSRTVDPLFPMY